MHFPLGAKRVQMHFPLGAKRGQLHFPLGAKRGQMHFPLGAKKGACPTRSQGGQMHFPLGAKRGQMHFPLGAKRGHVPLGAKRGQMHSPPAWQNLRHTVIQSYSHNHANHTVIQSYSHTVIQVNKNSRHTVIVTHDLLNKKFLHPSCSSSGVGGCGVSPSTHFFDDANQLHTTARTKWHGASRLRQQNKS